LSAQRAEGLDTLALERLIDEAARAPMVRRIAEKLFGCQRRAAAAAPLRLAPADRARLAAMLLGQQTGQAEG
jgi:hypothetical protein